MDLDCMIYEVGPPTAPTFLISCFPFLNIFVAYHLTLRFPKISWISPHLIVHAISLNCLYMFISLSFSYAGSLSLFLRLFYIQYTRGSWFTDSWISFNCELPVSSV